MVGYAKGFLQLSPFKRYTLLYELDDLFFLPWFKPKIPWNPAVMFVDFAIAPFPIIVFAGRNPEPFNEHNPRDIRLE